MESLEATVKLIPVYVIKTQVATVDGNWVRFEGSQERINLGTHDFEVGDHAEIRIRHVPG